MDIVKQNSRAWDKKVEGPAVIQRLFQKKLLKKGKSGDWEITVTVGKPVPSSWFPKSLKGLKILC